MRRAVAWFLVVGALAACDPGFSYTVTNRCEVAIDVRHVGAGESTVDDQERIARAEVHTAGAGETVEAGSAVGAPGRSTEEVVAIAAAGAPGPGVIEVETLRVEDDVASIDVAGERCPAP